MTIEEVLTGAVDIGGTKIHIGIVNRAGDILAEDFFPSAFEQPDAKLAMDELLKSFDVMCKKIGVSMAGLRGIGVGCTGPVNTEKGTVENPYTLPGWEGFEISKYLSVKSGLPVKMENDANAALLGEVYQRDLRDKKVLMVTVGTGIGVAFWKRGRLHRSGKYHPEMGHVIVSSKGERCYCGHKGCMESLCSGKALNKRAFDAGYADFDELYVRAGDNERKATLLLEQIRRDFANGFWNLNIVFKPEIILLAGGFAKKYFSFLEKIICEDSTGREDWMESFTVLSPWGNKNPALVGVNMLFNGLD